MTFSNSFIDNVICVDEVEIKYWEEGAFSKGYHKESAKISNAGSEEFEYTVRIQFQILEYTRSGPLQKHRPTPTPPPTPQHWPDVRLSNLELPYSSLVKRGGFQLVSWAALGFP